MSTREKLRTFIVEELQPEATASELTDDYPLLTSGVIDSIGVKALLHLVQRCAEMGVEPTFSMSGRIERVLSAMGLGSLSDLAAKRTS